MCHTTLYRLWVRGTYAWLGRQQCINLCRKYTSCFDQYGTAWHSAYAKNKSILHENCSQIIATQNLIWTQFIYNMCFKKKLHQQNAIQEWIFKKICQVTGQINFSTISVPTQVNHLFIGRRLLHLISVSFEVIDNPGAAVASLSCSIETCLPLRSRCSFSHKICDHKLLGAVYWRFRKCSDYNDLINQLSWLINFI